MNRGNLPTVTEQFVNNLRKSLHFFTLLASIAADFQTKNFRSDSEILVLIQVLFS